MGKHKYKIILVLLAMLLQMMPSAVLNISAQENKTNQLQLQAEAYQGVYDGNEHSLIQSIQGSNDHTKFQFCIGTQKECDRYENYYTELTKAEVLSHPALKIKDIGTYDIYLKGYDENYKTGSIKISASIRVRPVEIQTCSASKLYDSKPLTCDEYSVSPAAKDSGLLTGDTLTLSVKGYITDIGSMKNTVDNIKVVNTMGKDVTANYKFIVTPGDLVIKQPLKNDISFDDKTVTYNGDYQTLNLPYNGLDNNVYRYSTDQIHWENDMPVFRDAGEHVIYVKAENENAYPVYQFAVLTIERQSLTVKAKDAKKKFDNTPLTSSAYEIQGTLAANDRLVSVETSGVQIKIGTSQNIISNAVIMQGSENVTSNYALEYVNGNLEVTENLIGLTIQYVYANGDEGGQKLPEAYHTELNYLSSYSISVPELYGYQADKDVIEGIMPLEPVIITVTYSKNPLVPIVPVSPENPETGTALPIIRNVSNTIIQNQSFPPENRITRQTETVEETPTPLSQPKEEEILENETPLAKPAGSWALLNLVLAFISFCISCTFLYKNVKEEDTEIRKRHKWITVLGIMTGIISIIFFLLTENMQLTMGFVNEWTLLMGIFVIAQSILWLLARSPKEIEDSSVHKEV